jgi:2-methylcitrate dehydratase PrpD
MPGPIAAPLTRQMAAFALAPHDFPALARQRARDAITDCVGCVIAGGAEPIAQPLAATLPAFAEPGAAFGSLLIGQGRYAAPADAALFNGTLAHALDFDDTNHPAYAHPSAVLAPAMFAVVPLAKPSGRALIDAYIVGFELFGKLGRALNTQHYRRGWHTTGTFGALAAAASAGRLLGLDAQRMTMALGIAASSASGLRASFGSMTKPLHAGQAARNGVLAALLARHGMTASDEALEHRYGYLQVFNDGIGADPAPLQALGEALEILTEHGLALKPYAACGATHPGIEAAEQLHEALGGRAIRKVRAGVCEMAFAPLIHVMPGSPLEGKFSLHFCLAAALLHGPVTLATFSDERVNDPRVRELIGKISMELDERWRGDGEFATEVAVETEDGERLVRFVPLAAGKPARWFSTERLQRKFMDCAGSAVAQADAEPVWAALSDLDTVDGAAQVLERLARLHQRRG